MEVGLETEYGIITVIVNEAYPFSTSTYSGIQQYIGHVKGWHQNVVCTGFSRGDVLRNMKSELSKLFEYEKSLVQVKMKYKYSLN